MIWALKPWTQHPGPHDTWLQLWILDTFAVLTDRVVNTVQVFSRRVALTTNIGHFCSTDKLIYQFCIIKWNILCFWHNFYRCLSLFQYFSIATFLWTVCFLLYVTIIYTCFHGMIFELGQTELNSMPCKWYSDYFNI